MNFKVRIQCSLKFDGNHGAITNDSNPHDQIYTAM